MTNIRLHAWHSLKQTFPIRKSEWIAAYVLFGMSVAMLINPDMFQKSSGYDAMSRFAPQWLWQWALFGVGMARLAVLGINGAYWRTPHLRALMAFLSCFAWWQITAGLAPNLGLGLIAFSGYFIHDALNFKQALTEAGISEGLREAERPNVPTDQ